MKIQVRGYVNSFGYKIILHESLFATNTHTCQSSCFICFLASLFNAKVFPPVFFLRKSLPKNWEPQPQ